MLDYNVSWEAQVLELKLDGMKSQAALPLCWGIFVDEAGQFNCI